MTGPSGNRLSICPLRFRIASPRVPIDLGCAAVNRNSRGGDPESFGANRSSYYPRDQSLFVYYTATNTDHMISRDDIFSAYSPLTNLHAFWRHSGCKKQNNH